MSISVDTRSSTGKATKSAAVTLTDDEAKGIEILGSLQSVVRGDRFEDSTEHVVDNIFKNEMTVAVFVTYLRHVVGFEIPAQRAEVTRLLELRRTVT